MAILCVVFSIYILYRILNIHIKNKIICCIIAYLIILNPFLIELFLFFEKGILAFSILTSVCGAYYFIKLLEEKRVKFFIISILFMLIAVFSYQGTLSIFIGIGMVYIIKYSKNVKEFLLYNIIIFVIYAIPAVINYFLVTFIFSNTRVISRKL